MALVLRYSCLPALGAGVQVKQDFLRYAGNSFFMGTKKRDSVLDPYERQP